MALSTDLISQFVKITNDEKDTKKETTVYGTIVESGDSTYVKIDGSDLLTPITSTTTVENDQRVTVLIKDHTAVVTGNLSSPSVTDKVVNNKITEAGTIIAEEVSSKVIDAVYADIDTVVAEKIKAENLDVVRADIVDLKAKDVTIEGKLTAAEGNIADLTTDKLSADVAEAKYATIESLNATDAKFNSLSSTYATIENLNAATADIKELQTGKLDATEADIKYATISSLNAEKARIDNLDADVADIDTLIFGSASGDVIQTSFANAVIAQLGNAQIKSAMIENISADKITSGDIVTNNVRVMSEDGSLIISDETIQISDGTRVRVQIGKDSSNDYSINIWDADGNLMFSEGGITDSAIKNAIIRNDMVSEDANISASKLDISSLFTEINGSTETINATKIYLDGESKTLDVAFTSLTTDVTDMGESISSQGTQISTIQGQISSKVWQEDINSATNELNEKTDTLSTQYSTLEQDLTGISATVATHTTEIANKADSSTVTAVSDKVSELNLSLDGFKTSVSETYATKTDVDSLTGRVVAAETNITQNTEAISLAATKTEVAETLSGYYTKAEADAALSVKADEITSSISNTYATKQYVDDIEIGGRNLLRWTQGPTITEINDGTEGISLYKEGVGTLTYTNDGIKLTFDSSTNAALSIPLAFDGCVENGEIITLSFDYRGNITKPGSWYFIQRTAPNVSTNLNLYTTLTANETEWQHCKVTFSSNNANIRTNYRVLLFYNLPDYNPDNWVEIREKTLKLEKGNKATDWTPAPEDVDESISNMGNEIHETITEQNTSIIQNCEEIILEALTSYTETEDFETFKETINAQLQLLSDQMTLKFTETQTQLSEVNDSLQNQLNTITKYFTFNVDGLTIGAVDNPNQVVIDNDEIVIQVNGNAVQRFDSYGRGIVPKLEVTNSFNLFGYLIDQDSNGNVNCGYAGGEE